tara:strand:- start:349 stop:489 length:141 start_codon:yes stop_codon:yes gene_type:complete
MNKAMKDIKNKIRQSLINLFFSSDEKKINIVRDIRINIKCLKKKII